jgi:hypothetical protein
MGLKKIILLYLRSLFKTNDYQYCPFIVASVAWLKLADGVLALAVDPEWSLSLGEGVVHVSPHLHHLLSRLPVQYPRIFSDKIIYIKYVYSFILNFFMYRRGEWGECIK